MIIIRHATVTSTERYCIDVDDDLVFHINKAIAENNKEPFEAVTLEDVCNCWKQNGYFTRDKEVLNFSKNWHPLLGDYIRWYIDDEIWNNYEDVIDSEYGPHDDEVSD